MKRGRSFFVAGWILILSVGALFVFAKRDHGAALRLAAFEGDAQRVREIAGKHPEVLNSIPDQGGRILQEVRHAFVRERRLQDQAYTALDLAVIRNNVDAAIELMNAGAAINRPAGGGATTFQLAVQNGNRELIAQMIKHGANIEMPDVHGRTPLAWAILSRNKPVVKDLIAAGANVNDERALPIFRAVEVGDPDVLKEVLAAGANVNVKDFKGLTPLLLARTRNRPGIVELLQAHGAQ